MTQDGPQQDLEAIHTEAHRLVSENLLSQLEQMCLSHRSLLNETFFYTTLRRGTAEAVSLLIRLGADLPDERRVSALQTCGYCNRPDVAEMLLARGAPVDNPPIASGTPLTAAASAGAIETAELLIKHGADVDRDYLGGAGSALTTAEDRPPPLVGQPRTLRMIELLLAAGATRPWDYNKPEGFWDGVIGELTVLLVEGSLGLVAGPALLEHRSSISRFDVRRSRHGKDTLFQGLFTAGMTRTGGPHELALLTHCYWPTHRRAMEEQRFRSPVDFLAAVGQRVLETNGLLHGDVLDRDHPLVGGLEWPGTFNQWLAIEHTCITSRVNKIGDPDLPKIIFLLPHLEKKPLKPGAEAKAKADFKANVKWEKPALKQGRNNLVIPLCYEAPWLKEAGLL